MNKIVITLFLIFFTTSLSAAFEYHGFKSGMSREEVDEILGQDSSSCDYTCRKDYFAKLGRSDPPALWKFSFKFGKTHQKYLIPQGSISINGVSLTISKIKLSSFEVTIIPHTLKLTNLKNLKQNDIVNVEIDIFSKYIAKIKND